MTTPPTIAADAPDLQARGKILTFYSYKGGTGRSMALANLAWVLAMNNKRVLVIDWDLEAPGVHRYFHPFLEDKELQSTRGLMDFVEDLAARAAAATDPLPAEEGDVSSYVVSLDRSGWNWDDFGDRAGIDLIAAGLQNAGYSTKLSSFDWISFYTKLGGRRFLSYMASQLRSIYDYVLIDSRTGVCDTSGICTVELPDAVVVCFTLNEQSIRGAANVSESILVQRNAMDELRKAGTEYVDQGGDEFRIYPIPTRIDQSEFTKKQIGIELVQKTFSRYLGDLSQADLQKYWGELQMPYVPNYAFEEIPAVFGDLPYDQLSICAFIERLAKILTRSELISLQALPDELRRESLKWFQRASQTPRDSAQLAEEAFQRLTDDLKSEATEVLLRLVKFDSSGISHDVLKREELPRRLMAAADALVRGHILQSVSAQSGRSLQLADPMIIQSWPRYAGWIQDDFKFLQWRFSISSAALSWRLSNKSESGLRSGDSLEDARTYLRTRADELNVDERDYLSASIQHDEQSRTISELRRSTKETLEVHIARLEQELASKQKVTARKRWEWLSPMAIVAVAVTLLFAMGLAGLYRYSEAQRQSALQIAEVDAEKQRESEMNAEVQNAEMQLRLENSIKESQSAQKASSTTSVAPGSDKRSMTCHILATSLTWTLASPILVTVNNKPAGSFDTGAKGSSPLDFTCAPGENIIQMTKVGYSGVCSLAITTKDTHSFSPRFNLTNGIASCQLLPVLPQSTD